MSVPSVEENRRALISTIKQCDLDLVDLKMKKKDIDEELNDLVGDYQESKDIVVLKAELESKQKLLSAKLSQDEEFSRLMDAKHSVNLEIADTKEVLSAHVVQWKMLTSEDQVEFDDTMGKEVIVTGRLGKLQRYQTNLFSSEKSKSRLAEAVDGFQNLADKSGHDISISSGDKEVTFTAKRKPGRPKKEA